MNLQTIPGAALSSSLRLARLPIDQVMKLAGSSPASPVKLFLDRADAVVRGAVGSVLGDRGLERDADQRRRAAAEREKAADVRAEAEQKSAAADKRRSQGKRQAADARRRRKDTVDKTAKKERLDVLETKADAVEAKEAAMSAKQDAERLGKTASAAKAERKRS